MKNFFNNNKAIVIGAAILLVFAAITVSIIYVRTNPKYTDSSEEESSLADVSEGKAYIAAAEQTNTAEIEDRMFAQAKAAEKAKIIQDLHDNPGKIWETLRSYNTVIMGDSRAAGFWWYGYTDPTYTLAQASLTILNIPENYETLRVLNPKAIIISYGINDTGMGVAYNGTDYATMIHAYIDEIHQYVPDAVVFMNSIIPSLPPTYDYSPAWARIPGFNVEMKAYCEANGLNFIDITPLCEEHIDLYSSDMIHMQTEFYPYWGAAICDAVVDKLN